MISRRLNTFAKHLMSLCPVWMAPFLQVLICDFDIVRSSLVFGLLKRRTWPLALLLGDTSIACQATDGFHQPSPIPHIEQQSVPNKARGVLVLGLTIFHHFIGLAILFSFPSCLRGPDLVGLIAC